MSRTLRLAAVCAAAVLAWGCASPVARLYTLSAAATADAASAAGTPVAVVVGPVTIPTLVDQPQIVVSRGANQVVFDEFNRWASPLAEDISRVVALDLAAVLRTPQVRQAAQAAGTEGDFRVALDVQTFESTPGVAAVLKAAWSVRRVRDGKTVAGASDVREPAAGADVEALVAAHSRALAVVSRDIASAVRSLQR